MDIEEIKTKVHEHAYVYSHHADLERKADDLTLAQVEDAFLTGEILEQYPDTGRGERCLVVGFSGDMPIHAVCGWRGDNVIPISLRFTSTQKHPIAILRCRQRLIRSGRGIMRQLHG